MIELGKRQLLTIVKMVDFGAYLSDTADPDYKRDKSEEVLLPKKEVPRDADVSDSLMVFIYRDSSDRLIATTKDPYIHLGEVRQLTIKDVGKIGAFLDWGLPKDLLLPFGEQKGRPKAGEKVDVKMYVDKSGRLCASMWVTDEQKKTGAYETNARRLKDILIENGGFLPLTDKSGPEDIRSYTDMSKNEFKRAVGNLYKNRIIVLEDNGIKIK